MSVSRAEKSRRQELTYIHALNIVFDSSFSLLQQYANKKVYTFYFIWK